MRQKRHDQILAYLEEHRYLTVDEAVPLFDASPATIRRDFNLLAEEELVERSRGGLRYHEPNNKIMAPFSMREVQFSREKDAVARRAVELIEPDDVIIIDGGTTTFHIAGYLPSFPLRVITNSLRLASTLGEKGLRESLVDVFMVGGYLYPQSSLVLGEKTRDAISQYHARFAFLSVGGITEYGIYNTNELVVETEMAMIEHAERAIILADHSKIGKRAMCRLVGLDRIDVLITDRWPDNEEMLGEIEKTGTRVVIVDV